MGNMQVSGTDNNDSKKSQSQQPASTENLPPWGHHVGNSTVTPGDGILLTALDKKEEEPRLGGGAPKVTQPSSWADRSLALTSSMWKAPRGPR